MQGFFSHLLNVFCNVFCKHERTHPSSTRVRAGGEIPTRQREERRNRWCETLSRGELMGNVPNQPYPYGVVGGPQTTLYSQDC